MDIFCPFIGFASGTVIVKRPFLKVAFASLGLISWVRVQQPKYSISLRGALRQNPLSVISKMYLLLINSWQFNFDQVLLFIMVNIDRWENRNSNFFLHRDPTNILRKLKIKFFLKCYNKFLEFI